VAATPAEELVDWFEVEEVKVKPGEVPPSWNVAPTREVLAVAESKSAGGARQLGSFRWGLVPSWAKDPSEGARRINARAERVETAPTFRKAFASKRCLMPADAFYEWEKVEGEKRKQPWLVKRADGELMAFAGLWEAWRDVEGRWLRTCALITTESSGELARIHDRCPVILQRDDWSTWLDRDLDDTAELKSLLKPPPEDLLTIHRVGYQVGNVKNDDPSLVEPLPS
jgi:putative SOS response-associated peptidase YedK